MTRLPLTLFLGVALASGANAQVPASQSVASAQPANEVTPVETTKQPVALESDNPVDPASLLPELRPLSASKASLLGGTVTRLDRVRDELAVQVFGGGKIKVFFDPRTHIFSGGTPASITDLRKGDRVYIDTVLDGNRVFARSINLKSAGSLGESQGTVLSFRADNGELELRDSLSPEPLRIKLTPSTNVIHDGRPSSPSELVPGALVAVKFGAQGQGKTGGSALQIAILALPGSDFTFAGQVVGLDLSAARLVVNSATDHKTYEIYLDPANLTVSDQLSLGSAVSVTTNFDGTRYVARSLTVTQ